MLDRFCTCRQTLIYVKSRSTFYGDINLINTEIDIYRSITREEIKEVANKYLKPNQRLILDYVPTAEKAKN